jgi:hypothetical protein
MSEFEDKKEKKRLSIKNIDLSNIPLNQNVNFFDRILFKTLKHQKLEFDIRKAVKGI